VKKTIKAMLGFIIILVVILTTSSFSASAHSLQDWANHYTQAKANATYSFAIRSYPHHMNGSAFNYFFANSTVKSYFGTAISDGISSWGIISGAETTSANAHTKITYIPSTHPSNAKTPGSCTYYSGDANSHFRTGQQSHGNHDSEIKFYLPAKSYTTYEKMILSAHEVGHLWGIDDLYTVGKENLTSIYSQGYVFTAPTRHDKNAMRICLNTRWFDDGSGILKRLKSPGAFAKSEWIGNYYFDSSGYWRDPAFNLVYNSNGGTGTMAGKVIHAADNQTSACAFKKTGYSCIGWYAKRQSDGKWRYRNPNDTSQTGWYAEGSQPSGWGKYTHGNGSAGTLSTTTVSNANTATLYAKWSASYVSMRIGYNKAIHSTLKTVIDTDTAVKPYKKSGKTMIPTRFIGEKLGAKVTYTADADPIYIKYGTKTATIRIGNTTMTITDSANSANNKTVTLDVAPEKQNGRVFFPVRAVTEGLGFDVYYDASVSNNEIVVVSYANMNSTTRTARVNEARAYIM